jgi:hypothetical protein
MAAERHLLLVFGVVVAVAGASGDLVPDAPELGDLVVVNRVDWVVPSNFSSGEARTKGIAWIAASGCSNALCDAQLVVPPGSWPSGVHHFPRLYEVDPSPEMLAAVSPYSRTSWTPSAAPARDPSPPRQVPSGSALIGKVFIVWPHGLRLDKPALLTVRIKDPAELPSRWQSTRERQLHVFDPRGGQGPRWTAPFAQVPEPSLLNVSVDTLGALAFHAVPSALVVDTGTATHPPDALTVCIAVVASIGAALALPLFVAFWRRSGRAAQHHLLAAPAQRRQPPAPAQARRPSAPFAAGRERAATAAASPRAPIEPDGIALALPLLHIPPPLGAPPALGRAQVAEHAAAPGPPGPTGAGGDAGAARRPASALAEPGAGVLSGGRTEAGAVAADAPPPLPRDGADEGRPWPRPDDPPGPSAAARGIASEKSLSPVPPPPTPFPSPFPLSRPLIVLTRTAPSPGGDEGRVGAAARDAGGCEVRRGTRAPGRESAPPRRLRRR